MAVFGKKDYQQLCVIKRMVRDLDFAVEVVGLPTQVTVNECRFWEGKRCRPWRNCGLLSTNAVFGQRTGNEVQAMAQRRFAVQAAVEGAVL